nr:hypothetical protein [Pseudofrankia sp. BMG5.36]
MPDRTARETAIVIAPPWYDAALVALDLEGGGAQDREHEAILELAAVPLRGGDHGSYDHNLMFLRRTSPSSTSPCSRQRRERPDGADDELGRLGPVPAGQRPGDVPRRRHSGIFQFHGQFVAKALAFLQR